MSSASQFETNFFQQFIPVRIYNTSAASGTYQTAAADRSKLHFVSSPVDIYINSGTGSSVSVTTANGVYVAAGTTLYFHTADGAESLGWVTADGNAGRVTVGIVSR